jgi:hypothetical protein
MANMPMAVFICSFNSAFKNYRHFPNEIHDHYVVLIRNHGRSNALLLIALGIFLTLLKALAFEDIGSVISKELISAHFHEVALILLGMFNRDQQYAQLTLTLDVLSARLVI